MTDTNNVFKSLIDIFNKGVEEADKLGYADEFKVASNTLIIELQKGEPDYSFEGFTVEDVQHLDGYFIFGMGTNSVLHFHLKECPGWKFGVHWRVEDDEIRGEFFTQYEKIIDKFKPAASQMVVEISLNKEGKLIGEFNLFATLQFIRKEPELAFCRDYKYLDYNHVYLSRKRAKKIFKKWKRKNFLEEKYTKIYNQKVVDWVKNNICPDFNAEVIDKGDNWSPRYDVIAPLSYNSDIVDKPGCYGLEDDATVTKLEKLMNKFNKKADRKGFYWRRCFNYSIEVYDDSDLSKRQQ